MSNIFVGLQRVLGCICLFLLVVCLAGCGGGRGDRFYVEPNSTDTLVTYETQDPPTLDPAQSWGVFDGKLIGFIFSNLVRFDPKANIISDLASDWSVSDDGKVYTFTLRREATFSSGRSVTSEDVKYSFERILDPATASRSRWVLERIESIETPDPHTAVLRIQEPFTPFLGMLAMPAASIVPREEVEKAEQSNVPFGENPVGSGPWKFVEWKHDQYVKLVRDEDYWGIKPKMKNLIYRVISNEFTAIAEFETGHLTAIDPLPQAETLRWKTHPQWKEYTVLEDMLTLDMLVINTEKPVLDQPEVRRALAQTLETPLILQCVLEGAGTPANGPIPFGLPGSTPDDPVYGYQPDKAIAVLKKAGLMDRQIVLLLPSTEGFIRSTGEIVHAEWTRLGLNVKLLQLEWVTYKRMLLEGDFDVAYRGWFADYPDGDNFVYPLFHSSQIGLVNGSRFNDPNVDRMIEASQREVNQEKRTGLLSRINRKIYQASPAIFLWYRAKYVVRQPWIRNYEVPLIFNGVRHLTEEIVLEENNPIAKS